MNLRFALLILTALASAPKLAAQAKCEPLPVLQIDDGRRLVSTGGVSTYEKSADSV